MLVQSTANNYKTYGPNAHSLPLLRILYMEKLLLKNKRNKSATAGCLHLPAGLNKLTS